MTMVIADFQTVLCEVGSEDDPVVFRGKETTAVEVWYLLQSEYTGKDILDAPISYHGAKGFVKRGTMRGLIRDRRLMHGHSDPWRPTRCPSCGRFL